MKSSNKESLSSKISKSDSKTSRVGLTRRSYNIESTIGNESKFVSVSDRVEEVVKREFSKIEISSKKPTPSEKKS